MIDLTDVLTDPELGAETLVRLRVAAPVNDKGRAVRTETATNFTGIVTMDKAAILERVADGAYVAGSIMVTTATPLRSVGAGIDADIIQRGAQRYTVDAIGDYLQHGFNWAVGVPDGVTGGM